jgi:solute carrier family 25 phosphate transporter 23/24/25/41
MSASSSVPAVASTASKTETLLAVTAAKKTVDIDNKSFNVMASLISGAIAGGSSKTCTAPFSRLTILLQVSNASDRPNAGVFRTLNNIYQTEGLASLWRGNCTAVIQKFPAAAMSYYAFEKAKIGLSPYWLDDKQPGSAVRFAAGFAAGTASTTVTYPLDLVRTTLAANSDPSSASYRAGIGGTIGNIVRQGGLKSLFRGYGTSVICQGINLSLNFGIYESVQSIFFLKDQEKSKRTGLIGTLMVAPLTGNVLSFSF